MRRGLGAALVAVGANAELGGDVTEKLEQARSCDQPPAVVGIGLPQSQPQARGDLQRAISSSWEARVTLHARYAATSEGRVPRPKMRS